MPIVRQETYAIRVSADVVSVRKLVREWSGRLGFSLVNQTKIITAASELGRNTLEYGGGGTLHLEFLDDGERQGLRLVFEDHGPGISDISLAMRDGYSSGHGLGLGLGGAKRLSDNFEIQSEPGVGTKVAIVRWK